ncbi:MAG: CHAT domain-containing tetratricopeptide repeat protein [Chitinophagaceae bacterium]
MKIRFLLIVFFITIHFFSSAQSWNDMNDSLLYYYNNNDFIKAAIIGEKAVITAKKEFGQSHPDFATSINNLGTVYKKLEQYEKAALLLNEALNIRKTLLGKDHPDYASSLSELGALYRKTEQFKKAETCYVQLAEYFARQEGTHSLNYAKQLNYLGIIYAGMDSVKKAESFYRGSFEVIRKDNTDQSLLESVLYNVSNIYLQQKLYETAEPLFVELVSLQQKLYGAESEDYIASVENLAFIFRKNNKFKEAVPLRKEAVEYYRKTADNTLVYSKAIGNLAVLYDDMGLYVDAERFYLEAIALDKKLLGVNHEEYATDIYNLSALYKEIGQLQKAAVLLYEAKEIRKKVLGADHPDYGACLNDLANICVEIQLYDEAIKLFLEVKSIWENAYGKEHPYYAILLHNMAVLYHRMPDLVKAESLYIEAKIIRERTVGKNHPDYANSLNNLAALYLDMKEYEKAETFSIGAKEIYKKVYGENHSLYTLTLNTLAYIYESSEKYDKAELLFTEYQNIETKNLLLLFNTLSEKEKENYLANKLYLNNNSNNLIYNYRNASQQFYNGNYNLQLFLKSLLLSSTQTTLAAVRNNKDSSVQQTFFLWQSNKTALAKQYALPIPQRSENLNQLEIVTENLEKELSRKSVGFRKGQQGLQIRTTELKKTLKDNEVAVEFVRFQLYNKKWTDSMMYAAYILTNKDAAPVFVPLFEEGQLQQLLDSAGKNATSTAKVFYRGIEIENNGAASFGKDLYKLIWAPLEPYLNGIKKISYSPAGKLYSIAFHALPVDSNTLLIDKYNLQQYTSTRQVALRADENQTTKPSDIALFGDAEFSMDSLSLVKQRTNASGTEVTSTSIYTPENRGSRGGAWNDLPGTAEEVKKIKALFDENKIATKSFIQTTASEENLKALSGNSPQILHIATHGFFLPEPDKNKKETGFNQGNTYTLADDPLLRSGLILSGGNYAWSGKTPIEGVEDGIATAYEISQLNLSNTELVVLSACETALGDVKGSEGVFGLQRAFKMAGVKKLIVSLWQVPDKETAELMTAFYTYWMKGNTINESFTQAQADMRKRYSPFYWAAFVLVE